MGSRTSPPVKSKPSLWQHPLLGQPGGPSFGVAEALRRARTWVGREKLITAAHTRYQEAYREQRRSETRSEAYEIAEADFYAAMMNAYPPDYDAAVMALYQNQPADLNPLIVFLEADPYFYRSGYAKEDAIRFLKRATLTPGQAERLRRVVLTVVTRLEWRREWRLYSRLARAVDSPKLRADLEDLAKNGYLRERIRAEYFLHQLGRK